MNNKICFYHWNVNGDCWSSRLIVNHIINHTRHLGIEYFYNAHRSINSHCEDLGLPRENFNVLPYVSDHRGVHLINNVIYVNVWIGFAPSICWVCLSTLDKYYNELINDISKHIGFTIPPITPVNNGSLVDPYVPFNFSNFDHTVVQKLKEYVEQKRQTYKKIVLIQNYNVTTTINLNNIPHSQYIYELSLKFPNYQFIPYMNVSRNCMAVNVAPSEFIFNECNIQLRNGEAFLYLSYLSTLCDKVILLASGPALYTFNEENRHVRGKILLIDGAFIPGISAPSCPINKETQELCACKFNICCKYHCYSNYASLLDCVINFVGDK